MFPEDAYVAGTVAYYPDLDTATARSTESEEYSRVGADCGLDTFIPPDRCCRTESFPSLLLAESLTLDLGTLGLVPPFRFDVP